MVVVEVSEGGGAGEQTSPRGEQGPGDRVLKVLKCMRERAPSSTETFLTSVCAQESIYRKAFYTALFPSSSVMELTYVLSCEISSIVMLMRGNGFAVASETGASHYMAVCIICVQMGREETLKVWFLVSVMY